MSRFTFPDTHGDLLGAHISTKGGLHTVFDRAAEINASRHRALREEWESVEGEGDDR